MKIDLTSAIRLTPGDLQQAQAALRTLKTGTGAGSEFTGWTTLPQTTGTEEFRRICQLGKKLYEEADALIVIGIGGSYMGARSAIELLKTPYHNQRKGNGPAIYFLGNGICAEDIRTVLQLVEGTDYYVNVISKSGTTLEPALAFRVLKQELQTRLGKEEAARHIICTTDKARGALKTLADAEGYECFVIPDDVGGRYSVLTAVGLLPMAAAGIDIRQVMEGAAAGMKEFFAEEDSNPALLYSAARIALYRTGKKIEIFSYQGEKMRSFAEWYKQLFGESEGKELGGIFPASCQLTADLHSLGQYIQEGERILMESIVRFEKTGCELVIPKDDDDLDGLNYTAGKTFDDAFLAAAQGVKKAHADGGVPVMELIFDRPDEWNLGYMTAFYEVSCAVSSYMRDINPFNQPGVEAYKKNMFTLLGKYR
ncbi:MAG: glucose-6-phosphate isomerase [Firmicutes bacterium]|nr:glucose-6-phosphate isomerase [Bacillota bacterium]